MEWLWRWQQVWQWLLNEAYWYCLLFFLLSISAEELLAPKRRWRNRDDCIVYGQREDSPANIRAGRSPAPANTDHLPLRTLLKPGWKQWAGSILYS